MSKIQLLNDDCLKAFSKIESNSIDMVLCDPPYGTTACKWDKIIPIEVMWKELKRITKPKGAIVLTAVQPFTSLLITSNLKMFKYCWTWLKTKPTGYQIAKVKPLSKTEDICVFCKSSPKYYPKMVLRDKPRSGKTHRTNNQIKVSNGGVHTEQKVYTHYYPTTVIEISNGSQKNKIHPTQKPVELMEYLISTYTERNDVVLDFAMGSGSTGVAALRLNRKFIGIEKDAKFYSLARNRIQNLNE